jgi:hypothetical protein
MEFLLGKKFKKSKTNAGGDKNREKEDEKIRKQLEKEMKKQEKINQKNKSDNLRSNLGTSSSSGNTNQNNTIETNENLPDSEGGKYHVSEVIKITMPSNRQYDLKIEFLDNNSKNSTSMWAIDGMLIDEELLYAEDEEADRIYQELKARSFRRRKMEESENRLSNAMMHD